MKRREIYSEISKERTRQDEKWDRRNDQAKWSTSEAIKLMVLAEEFGEVAHAVNDRDIENLKEELIQMLAVGVCWLESLENEFVTWR